MNEEFKEMPAGIAESILLEKFNILGPYEKVKIKITSIPDFMEVLRRCEKVSDYFSLAKILGISEETFKKEIKMRKEQSLEAQRESVVEKTIRELNEKPNDLFKPKRRK
jgi:hypothetical protein